MVSVQYFCEYCIHASNNDCVGSPLFDPAIFKFCCDKANLMMWNMFINCVTLENMAYKLQTLITYLRWLNNTC